MEKQNNGVVKMTVSGVLIGVIFTLVAVVIFALILNFCTLPDGVIKGVNQFVKFMSVFVGCFFALRGSAGWLKGLITGLAIFAVSYLIFALITGTAVFGTHFFIDLAFGAVAGMLSGIIAVNVKKDK